MARSGNWITQPTAYKAFIPSPIPPNPPIQYDDELHKVLSEADIALGRLDTTTYFLPTIEHLLAMYVRKEALLSSQIEGTQASLEDIFEYEKHMHLKNAQDVEEVVNYVKALNHGLSRLEEFPMSIRLIKEIHAILLTGTRGKEKTPGEFKRSQNWIGPAGCNLNNASFVPPPPAESLELMSQLELFLHREVDLPPLIACALIHYQFETIHPFLDGNGRVGRLLITFYLCWRKILQKPLLYLSYYFKMHRQEYYDRLNMVRNTGNYEQWIKFFLKGVKWTSDSALDSVKKVLNLAEIHKSILLGNKIASPLAIALLDYLFTKPLVSVNDVADHFSLSYGAAKKLVQQFEETGILRDITGKKRDRLYSYWEYMDTLAEGTKN